MVLFFMMVGFVYPFKKSYECFFESLNFVESLISTVIVSDDCYQKLITFKSLSFNQWVVVIMTIMIDFSPLLI